MTSTARPIGPTESGVRRDHLAGYNAMMNSARAPGPKKSRSRAKRRNVVRQRLRLLIRAANGYVRGNELCAWKRLTNIAPYDSFSRKTQLFLGVLKDQQFRRLREKISARSADDELFKTNALRWQRRGEIEREH